MALFRCSSGGGGGQTIKDICKNALTNSSFTQYSLSAYNSRATINEGGVAVDSTNKIAYLYADFTTLVASQSQNNTGYAEVTNAIQSGICPLVYGGGRGGAALITDEESTFFNSFLCYPNTSTQILIMNTVGQSCAIGERIIVYGAWSVTP